MHKVDWLPCLSVNTLSVTFMTVSRNLERRTGGLITKHKMFFKGYESKRGTCWKKGFRVLRRKA